MLRCVREDCFLTAHSLQLHTLFHSLSKLCHCQHQPEYEAFFNLMSKRNIERMTGVFPLNTNSATCMCKDVRVCGSDLLSCSSLLMLRLCRLFQLLSITAAVGNIYSDKEGRREEPPQQSQSACISTDQFSTDLCWRDDAVNSVTPIIEMD